MNGPNFALSIEPAELKEKLDSGAFKHYKNFDPEAHSPIPQRQMQRYHTMLSTLRTRFGTDNVILGAALDLESGEIIEDPGKSKALGVYVTSEAMAADQAAKQADN